MATTVAMVAHTRVAQLVPGAAAAMAILAVVVASGLVQPGLAQGEWRIGRGTFYGNEPFDAWSIHKGKCGLGYIWPNQPPTGWDVAAMADAHPDFDNSCGRCYEIACNPMQITDGYGNHIDRTRACRDPSESVVVSITDDCPCYYPDNAYSNKRWCCGDYPHLDLSVWAFEKLADTKYGVIPLKYRWVPCDYKPSNPAPVPQISFPGVKPPPGAVNPYDTGKVNSKVIKYLPTDPASTESYYISTASSFVLPASSPAASSPAPKPSPPAAPSSSAAASQQSADPASSASSSTSAYAYAWLDSPQSGFFDASWLAEVYPNSAGQGLDGSNALCAKLDTSGALALRSKDLGKFAGKRSLQFYVKTDQGVPDIHINLAGAKGSCRPAGLMGLQNTGTFGAYARYDIFLPSFSSANWLSYPTDFAGCGGNGYFDVNTIEFRNFKSWKQWACVDNVMLYY